MESLVGAEIDIVIHYLCTIQSRWFEGQAGPDAAEEQRQGNDEQTAIGHGWVFSRPHGRNPRGWPAAGCLYEMVAT